LIDPCTWFFGMREDAACTVNERGPQIRVASLAYTQQYGLASGAHRLSYKPGCEFVAAPERFRVTHCCDRGGGSQEPTPPRQSSGTPQIQVRCSMDCVKYVAGRSDCWSAGKSLDLMGQSCRLEFLCCGTAPYRPWSGEGLDDAMPEPFAEPGDGV
jgi:hypothetical protein